MKNRILITNLVATSAALSGVITLAGTLAAIATTRHIRVVLADAHLSVIAGLSLIYLASLLRRGKHNAWLISIGVYIFLIIRNLRHSSIDFHRGDADVPAILGIFLPLVTLIVLIVYRRYFDVRSEIRSFAIALRRSAIVLLVTFLYGAVGFQLFDRLAFHQDIGPATAVHYTIDQIGLTTPDQPIAHDKRARFFVDSLAALSVTAVFYAAVSFFSPIRFRLRHDYQDIADAKQVLADHALTSEDFFKLWPHDKAYFFNQSRTAFLAFKVTRGTALVVGDPAGPSAEIRSLVLSFFDYCRLNDWKPALIHTGQKNLELFSSLGLSSQKIGEEAVVDTTHFNEQVARNKYFRHINNKFSKAGYSVELIEPPFAPDFLARLRQISDDWSKAPGRAERGFMMGYFSEEYLNQCNLIIVKNAQGQIEGFLNQIPSVVSYEASYDFLRHLKGSPSNLSDFLMIKFIELLGVRGITKLNMGLCPLAGVGSDDQDKTAIDNLLSLVYTKAGRIYSFQGLTRFKSKYEPEWQDRYVVYRGGLAGFSRSMNALIKAMDH